jgi:hypothetical protein
MPRPGLSHILAVALILASAGCDPIAVPVGDPAGMGAEEYVQIANPGDTITVGVRVVAITGRPVPDVRVTWAVIDGGGAITPINEMTDEHGLAEARWALGMVAGEQVARASVRRLPSVDFVVDTGEPDID